MKTLCKIPVGIFVCFFVLALAPLQSHAAEVDYFTYGTVANSNVRYVKVNLEQDDAWSKTMIPPLYGDQCETAEEPNLRRSVGQNRQTEERSEENCQFTNWAYWRQPDGGFENYRFVVNANFYSQSPPYAYSNACGKALGVSIRDGAWISGQDVADRTVHDRATHTLVIYKEPVNDKRAAIVANTYDFAANLDNIQAAISGFRFMNGGNFVAQPAGISPNIPLPRTQVGVTEDGNHLVFLSINRGDNNPTAQSGDGSTLRANGKLYETFSTSQTLGVVDALTLDGSGSAQIRLSRVADQAAVLYTQPSDTRPGQPEHQCTAKFYRPVPVMMAIE